MEVARKSLGAGHRSDLAGESLGAGGKYRRYALRYRAGT
jgi:hypothetical protein